MENESTLPILTAPEIRVLGALIEKSRSTPEYYPMTLNALTAACNQKTSRNPVTDYDEETVAATIASLKGRSLVATAVGGGSRVLKYKHNFGTVFDVSDAELVVLCLLFLRSAQTPGELNTNSGRLYEFKDLNEVLLTLDKLQSAHRLLLLSCQSVLGKRNPVLCICLEEIFLKSPCHLPMNWQNLLKVHSRKDSVSLSMNWQF